MSPFLVRTMAPCCGTPGSEPSVMGTGADQVTPSSALVRQALPVTTIGSGKSCSRSP